MKTTYLIPLAAAILASASFAQTTPTSVFRCSGNVYTNDANEARVKGCKSLDGSNVTVIQGTKVNNPVVRVATAPQAAGQRVDADEQKTRDADSRAILEAELRKAETLRADLAKEYNNGEPEMLGPEHRNHQKYLDRVAELKASIARTENDIAGLKRELARVASK
jgi:hypothetical protein